MRDSPCDAPRPAAAAHLSHEGYCSPPMPRTVQEVELFQQEHMCATFRGSVRSGGPDNPRPNYDHVKQTILHDKM